MRRGHACRSPPISRGAIAPRRPATGEERLLRAHWTITLFVVTAIAVLSSVGEAPLQLPGVYAQGAGAAPQGGAPGPGRGAPPGAPGAAARSWARPGTGHPGAAGRRDAAADRSVLVEELLQGPGELARQALLPLQQPAAAVRHVGRPAHRAEAAGIGVVGQLRRRLAARAHREPVRLQDGEGTLRGAAGPGEGEGRPDRLHEGDRAGLGRLLPPRRPGGSRLRVDLGRHAAVDGDRAAHARVSEAHGADAPTTRR